jgi:uncharacterized protein (DUF1800 family)
MSNQETLLPPARQHTDEADEAVGVHTEITHGHQGSPAALTALAAAAALAACGGGDDGSAASTNTTAGAAPQAGTRSQAAAYSAKVAPPLRDAHRFLVQATFGPKPGEPEALMKPGALEAWLVAQFATSPIGATYLLTKQNYEDKTKMGGLYPDGIEPNGYLLPDHLEAAWWQLSLTAPEQLCHRVAFALSEILVISMNGGQAKWPYMCASYCDLLLRNAFGNYKDLVTQVAGHPAMGMYLSHLSNRRPRDASIPDQNFARELMQLFTLGLVNLKGDGTVQTDSAGKPVETYKPYDVEVLSHVFTGWGWRHTFSDWFGGTSNIDSQTAQMVAYPGEHSAPGEFPRLGTDGKIQRYAGTALTGAITLLGQTFTPSGDPTTDRAAAIDIIFQHQNLAPFVAKAMIQRLVTSNPSAAYVGRAAAAFKASAWSMQTLIQTILLDVEARDTATLCDVQTSPTYGKLKEPLLRVTQFMRAMKVRSTQDGWVCGALQTVTNSPKYSLGQAPLMSPTVFNFFRPGYVSPGGEMAKRSLVTPEMQLSSETEVAVYVRFMMAATRSGFGYARDNDVVNNPICNLSTSNWSSIYPDYSEELAALIKPGASAATRITNFTALVNRKLFGNAMSAGLQNHLKTVATNMAVGSWGGTVKDFDGRANRGLNTLLTLCVISPEFVVQR